MTKVLCDVKNKLFNEVDVLLDNFITDTFKEVSYVETEKTEKAVFTDGIKKLLVETSFILNKHYSLKITDITEA